MKRRNLGVSNVITTVILTSVMLMIVLTTSFMSNNILNNQIERTQFDQAKNVILTLDKIVKKVTYKPQSSGYVKASFWTTTPYFVETGENLQVWVDQTLEVEVPINQLKIQGGSAVGVAVPEDLVGNASLLLTRISDSLGRVSVNQSDGAWITLDYSRARCIYSGTSEYYNGSDYELYNIVEITIIEMSFGLLNVQDKAYLTAQNIGVESGQSTHFNDFAIRVNNTESEETICLSDLGGDPNLPTIINFVIIAVEISIIGGG